MAVSRRRSSAESKRRTGCSRGWLSAGVDYDDVVETLEAEAIEKFSGSLSRVVAGLEARRQELAPSGGRR